MKPPKKGGGKVFGGLFASVKPGIRFMPDLILTKWIHYPLVNSYNYTVYPLDKSYNYTGGQKGSLALVYRIMWP